MEISKEALTCLRFITRSADGTYSPAAGVRKQQLQLMWELRSQPAEAYLVGKALPFFYRYFVEDK